MNIINFIINHWDDICLILAFIISMISVVKRKDLTFLKEQVFKFVTDAEKRYKEIDAKTGEIKKIEVLDEMKNSLLLITRIFTSAKKLKQLLEDELQIAKKKWEENPKILESNIITLVSNITNIAESEDK